jgi:N-acetylmuramic acid 6-phosphate (MurNAc-6-P) etherase
MLTTLSMVQYGKCLENLMIDLMPANAKLRDRALRITLLLIDNDKCNEDMAKRILEKNSYDIKRTVFELRTEISNSETVI